MLRASLFVCLLLGSLTSSFAGCLEKRYRLCLNDCDKLTDEAKKRGCYYGCCRDNCTSVVCQVPRNLEASQLRHLSDYRPRRR